MDSPAFMENLRQLFSECDLDNNGSLGRLEFAELCSKIGLNKEAAEETFDRLDIDRDDRITFDEFAAGFNQYKQTSPKPQQQQQQQQQSLPSSPSETSHNQSQAPKIPARSGRLTSGTASPSRIAGRKSASPLGVLSLAGGDSTGGSSGQQVDESAPNSVFSSSVGDTNSSSQTDPSVVIYSSESMGQCAGDMPSGSGSQFGSLMSSSGSFNQVRNMQDLLESVQKLQSENQILTQIFFKDKREREEYINQLGEEFDLQVREVEARANKRAQEELENEKKRLREMMQTERETLQRHYQTIEKMSKLIKTPNGKLGEDGEIIDKVKSKLEDTYLENRQLKKSLLDTKSDVAMIWKEMEKLKRQYEDKLSSAYERNNETRNECDHIKQQLNLMKDSNRKLQDASDVITHYIADKVEPVIKGVMSSDDLIASGGPSLTGSNRLTLPAGSQAADSRRGSILSEYLNDQTSSIGINNHHHHQNTNLNSIESLDESSSPSQTRSRVEADDEGEDRLSGTSSSMAGNLTRPNKPKRRGSNSVKVGGNKLSKSSSYQQQINTVGLSNATLNQLELDNLNAKQQSISQVDLSRASPTTPPRPSKRGIGRHFFIGSRAQSENAVPDAEQNKQNAANAKKEAHLKGQSLDKVDEPIVEPADGGPIKAIFNIILVGDSFVGKSSFAARFMEGNFVQGLISNCSIDFKTKSYKVDGANYTVNLWDTAGQERFRSITASYFRKADGIILMYDVTDKRSYLNVRNWMSTISDTAAENVAVLLIGNKIDLRHKGNQSKCVPTEEGFRLAKEYKIVFLETSVKTGTNLVPSMGKLIRLIAKNNTLVEEDKDRIKLNDKSKSFHCMPKNC